MSTNALHDYAGSKVQCYASTMLYIAYKEDKLSWQTLTVGAMQHDAMQYRVHWAFPVTCITCAAQVTCMHTDNTSHMPLS